MKFLPFMIVLLWSSALNAQIQGTIKDEATSKSIKGATVFINGSTLYSSTDKDGFFVLESTAPGFHELVVYQEGYRVFKSLMNIQPGKAYNLSLALKPAEHQDQDQSEVNSDVRKEVIERLSSQFNTGAIGRPCVIVNEKVIRVKGNADHPRLSLSQPLMIENKSLGFRIYIFGDTLHLPSQGAPTLPLLLFKEITPATDLEMERRNESRYTVYLSSLAYFLRSLLDHESTYRGFEIIRGDGTVMKADSIVSLNPSTSLAKIKLTETVQVVHHLNGIDNYSQLTPQGSISVTNSGLLLDRKALLVQGSMKQEGLFERLPYDYVPAIKDYRHIRDRLKRYQEKIYVATDKPYYYQGEAIWWRGFIHYADPSLRDSLSKTMYVDLVDGQGKPVFRQISRIDSTGAAGDFLLPDSIPPGNYYLLAYTNFMRNFGDRNLFVKPVPILGLYESIEHTSPTLKEEKSGVVIKASKAQFKTREKIELKISTLDGQKIPVAGQLAMSVTDMSQVSTVDEPSILSSPAFQQKDPPQEEISFQYPLEFGVTALFQYSNPRSRGESVKLSVIKGNMEDVIEVETDPLGRFWINGLEFYDSTTFFFKSKKDVRGTVTVFPKPVPVVDFAKYQPKLKIIKTDRLQRSTLDFVNPKDNKMLEDITVRASKIPAPHQYRPYGRADHVYKAEDLHIIGNNLVQSLIGKIPGLSIYSVWEGGLHYMVRIGRQQSIQGNTEPLVTLDDVPMDGRAGDILQTIDASTIESIEVTTHLNPLYGGQGRAGVIALYTRKGYQGQNEPAEKSISVKLDGFHTPRSFKSPDYSLGPNEFPDFRSTIYWNPNLRTDASGVAAASFFSADLPGQYRISIEGVSSKGEPLRGVAYLRVE